MRSRLVIAGLGEEVLQLLPSLAANPELEIALLYHPDLEQARSALARLDPELRAALEPQLSADLGQLEGLTDLQAVIEADRAPEVAEAVARLVARGVQAVSPLSARLLFAHGISKEEHKTELLQALHEIVESVDLTVDAGELFSRVLEVAVGVTGAEGGSLMLFDTEDETLRVACALGIERELWAKIRVRLGEGIAGRAAAERRTLRVRGRAGREEFRLMRDRRDLQCALSVPLLRDDQLLGVLNLHSSRSDAITAADAEFVEELARLDAEIIARAQERDALQRGATRYEAVREVREALSGAAPLLERLGELCRRVATRSGNGIATLYLHDVDEGELRLAATSLEGGGFAGEYRFRLGEGVDGVAGHTREPAFLRDAEGRLAYAALPLLDGDKLVGVFSVQRGPEAGRAPLDEEAFREFLGEIAAAAAAEIADADRETRMAARATRMNAINEMGCRLLSCDDLAEIASLATSSAALVLAADHAVLRLQDESTRRYVIRSYYGSGDGGFQEKLFRLDKRVSVDVIKERTILLIRDCDAHADYGRCDAGVRSLLAAPLKQDGRVVGTLGLYEKVAADRFYPGTFNDEDLRVFSKYVSYVERAVAHARAQARVREERNYDELTGLPNATYLGRRIDQELARADGRADGLALLMCRVENLAEVRAAGDPIRAERVLLRAADALREHLRPFDELGRTGEADFVALLPDPGPDPEERVYSLARSAADAVAQDEGLNDPVRVALAFGYALYPAEGRDREALLARASQPRIRML